MDRKFSKWLQSRKDVETADRIIDLGCGNGWTLITLAKLGYRNLVGVDYSEKAVDLARRVAEAENFTNIKYQVCDLVSSEDLCNELLGEFSVALDKGTYDAISLSPDDSLTKRNKYKVNLAKLVKKNGFFIISSCNWTEQELKDFFEDCFSFIEVIPPPKTFKFGGKTGNDYSTVVLQRKS